MKLSKLKKLLIEKNNQLPENKRRTSSVSKEFVSDLESTIGNLSSDKLNESISNKIVDSTYLPPVEELSYNQSNELSGLSSINNVISEVKPIQPSSFIETENRIDEIKIIGITGSLGKSTTAFIVHEYLKSLGKKSVLYSSIRVDSPASYVNINEACEIPLQNESVLLDIIEEAEKYQAEYIILEINESAIKNGLIEGIPFSVRALTNINRMHNEEHYSPDEYVRIKESFFENIPDDEECISVLGLTGDITREEFNRLMRINSKPKITFGSKFICEVRNADYTNLDILFYDMKSDLDGLEMKIRVKDKPYEFKTNVILTHNALNFTCAIAIIQALNLFNENDFNKCINNIVIPGREEVIIVNNRAIIIGFFLSPALENFKEFRANVNINKIKVVAGAVGTGFKTWNKEFSSESFISKRGKARKYAMDYVKKNADFIYITSNDNAAEDPLSIAQEMNSYLSNQIPSTIIVDRKEAIRKAIEESDAGDIIYISGRGNRRIFCDSATSITLFQDREVVLETLKELGW